MNLKIDFGNDLQYRYFKKEMIYINYKNVIIN